MLHSGWSDASSVSIGAAGGTYLCCRLSRCDDSCSDDEEIKKNQEETKGIRSRVRRTKDVAAGNVVIFVGYGAEF